MEQYEINWKNYYEILNVSPNADSKAIGRTYRRLNRLYQHLLSRYPDVAAYSERLNDLNQAYSVLSDRTRRTAYDAIFRVKYSSQEGEPETPTKDEIVDLLTLVANNVSKWRARKQWGVLSQSKMAQRVFLMAVLSLLLVIIGLIGGTSLALAKPEHTLATPFRGSAVTVLETSSAAISWIKDIRRVVAAYERSIVSTAVQSMRVTEGLGEVPPVTIPTNDMAHFPSAGYPLFPHYLDRQFSQFRYTVNREGIVSVDTSGATTEALLEKIDQLLRQLAQGE